MTARVPDRAPIFLDTAYVYALVNTRLEIADGLATVRYRVGAIRVITALRASSLVEIVPATSELFTQALALYQDREDKDWGLTDCSSFVTMTRNGIISALTTDEHFRQAGFLPLLLESSMQDP